MRDDILDLTCVTFYVGTSAVIGLSGLANQNNLIVKAVSAGSSGVYIGGASMSVGLGAGLSGLISNGYGGYLMSTNEILSLSMSSNAYFTAAGSTATISAFLGKSAQTTIGATVCGGP